MQCPIIGFFLGTFAGYFLGFVADHSIDCCERKLQA
jgi:hypothetical protein